MSESSNKISFADAIHSVTITAKEELRRRAELQAIRRELLALVREDEEFKKEVTKKVQASKEKKIALTERLQALINN